MNFDHSLLTYSFYKQPSFILRLFQIRLREIMKINAVPALVIGIGLALILFATGGTDNPLNYVVLIVSILCMSLFFSIHYLTIYYLLQPYNAGTELKSGTYRIVLSVTYVVCFALMRLRMPIMIFGIMTIVFCALYSVVASILVYRLAPKTFRPVSYTHLDVYKRQKILCTLLRLTERKPIRSLFGRSFIRSVWPRSSKICRITCLAGSSSV